MKLMPSIAPVADNDQLNSQLPWFLSGCNGSLLNPVNWGETVMFRVVCSGGKEELI